MATVAGRKKSIVSNPGLVIETPVANNNILNKAASASTSLYQQCSSLRARLMRIPNFSHFFILSSPNGDLRQSTDPVTQLWDCFTLGIPLCFLFNLLPPPTRPIGEISTDPVTFDVSNEKEKKRAIAKFAMRLSEIDNCERFTVSDLWDRHSTDGLVKVRSPPLSTPIRNLEDTLGCQHCHYPCRPFAFRYFRASSNLSPSPLVPRVHRFSYVPRIECDCHSECARRGPK